MTIPPGPNSAVGAEDPERLGWALGETPGAEGPSAWLEPGGLEGCWTGSPPGADGTGTGAPPGPAAGGVAPGGTTSADSEPPCPPCCPASVRQAVGVPAGWAGAAVLSAGFRSACCLEGLAPTDMHPLRPAPARATAATATRRRRVPTVITEIFPPTEPPSAPVPPEPRRITGAAVLVFNARPGHPARRLRAIRCDKSSAPERAPRGSRGYHSPSLRSREHVRGVRSCRLVSRLSALKRHHLRCYIYAHRCVRQGA